MTEPTTSPLPEYKTACGGKFNDSAKYPSAMYGGEQIYFCTRACLRALGGNPDAFMAGEVEHGLKEE